MKVENLSSLIISSLAGEEDRQGTATPRQPVMIIYDIHVKTVVVFGI